MQRTSAKQSQFIPAQRNRWGRPHPTSGGDRVKQSQSSPAGRQAGSSGRRNVRNKANSRPAPPGNRMERRQTNPIRVHLPGGRTPSGRRVRNKPNSRRCRAGRGRRGVGRAANAQNEAKLGRNRVSGKWSMRPDGASPERGMRETNPIRPGLAEGQGPWGSRMRNKANFGRHPVGGDRKGEGREAIVRNKANFGQAGHGPGVPALPLAPAVSGLGCGGAQIPCRAGGRLYNDLPQKQLDGSGLCVREAGSSWYER